MNSIYMVILKYVLVCIVMGVKRRVRTVQVNCTGMIRATTLKMLTANMVSYTFDCMLPWNKFTLCLLCLNITIDSNTSKKWASIASLTKIMQVSLLWCLQSIRCLLRLISPSHSSFMLSYGLIRSSNLIKILSLQTADFQYTYHRSEFCFSPSGRHCPICYCFLVRTGLNYWIKITWMNRLSSGIFFLSNRKKISFLIQFSNRKRRNFE